MKSILTTLIVALLVQPATALARAATVLVPPGDSAASQYVETVPTDRGGALPGSGKQSNALTPGQRRSLAALGPDGRTLVAVVQETAPALAAASGTTVNPARGPRNRPAGGLAAGTNSPGRSGSAGSSRSAGSTGALSAAGAPSTAGLVLSAATGAGGGGLGIFLPLLLLASVLGVIFHFIRRWRARGS